MITYVHLANDVQLALPSRAKPFRCVLLIDRQVAEDVRKEICRDVIAAGCLFAMTWGRDCELWHDEIDAAAANRFSNKTVPDSRLVLTTWHGEETLEELLHFAKYTARNSYAGECLEDLVVLDLGPKSRSTEVRGLFDLA